MTSPCHQGCPQNGQTQAPEGYAWAADDCDDTDENISPSLINCDEVGRNMMETRGWVQRMSYDGMLIVMKMLRGP